MALFVDVALVASVKKKYLYFFLLDIAAISVLYIFGSGKCVGEIGGDNEHGTMGSWHGRV